MTLKYAHYAYTKKSNNPKTSLSRNGERLVKTTPICQPSDQPNNTNYLYQPTHHSPSSSPRANPHYIINHERTRPPLLYTRKQCPVITQRCIDRIERTNRITLQLKARWMISGITSGVWSVKMYLFTVSGLRIDNPVRGSVFDVCCSPGLLVDNGFVSVEGRGCDAWYSLLAHCCFKGLV